jgi:hypothetical protein
VKVLLDHSVPRPTLRLLSHHDCRTAFDEGWDALTNGELLNAAEAAGFECLLTADTNIRYQQNLTTRRVALVVLSTNTWAVIRDNAGPIVAAVDRALSGSYTEVALPRPPRVRRPPPSRAD